MLLHTIVMGAGHRAHSNTWPQFCAACVGKAIAHGASVGRPHSSALAKLAMRPKNNPKQLLDAIKSPTDQGFKLFFGNKKWRITSHQ